jgi:hypothetical protein
MVAEKDTGITKYQIKKDRPWNEYPIGTKAYAFNGGYWERVRLG